MTCVATYIGVPVWVGLATGSVKWGLMAFILIAFWLDDLLTLPKRKKK